MRGRDFNAAVKFSPVRRGRDEEPAVPGYLYDNALQVIPRAASEYDARRGRLIPPVYQRIKQAPVLTPRKDAYRHVARVPAGGWGHVPAGDPAKVERKERLEQLRRDVKREC